MGRLVGLGVGVGLLLCCALVWEAQAKLSEPTGSVKGRAPVASGVVISNQSRPGVQPRVGNVLRVGYSFADVDGDAQSGTSIQWKRGATTVGTASTYTTQAADANQSLRVEVLAQTDPSITDPASGAAAASASVVVAAAGAAVGVGNFLPPTSEVLTWTQAFSHCGARGGRLPTRSELQQLFVSATSATAVGQSNYEMCSLYGWPLGVQCGGSNSYWTSDSAGGVRYRVLMDSGVAYTNSDLYSQVACVR